MRAQIHTAEQPDSDISAFFLSCDRLDLLDLTITSFFQTAGEPVKLVIYDDSGNPDVFRRLAEQYGNKFDIICFAENRGLNVAYDFMSSYCHTKYLFYVEDDWYFQQPGYLQLSRHILESYPIVGNIDLTEPLCRSCGCVGEETEDFYWKNTWRISEQHFHWIGWCGSPNLKRRDDYIRLGRIEELGPEWLIDRKFHLTGLKSVFTKTPYVKHIGDGRSKMEGRRPPDWITPCEKCPYDAHCELPRINWFYVESPDKPRFYKTLREVYDCNPFNQK